MIYSETSEKLGRFLTTDTDFGPIPKKIYDTDFIYLLWLFVECSRSDVVLDPAFQNALRNFGSFQKVQKNSESSENFGTF